MKAIELLVNGRRICVAGSGPPELTFTQVTLDERDGLKASILVAGSKGKMVPIWVEEHVFQEGDEVTIRVIDVHQADAPVKSEQAWETLPCGPATKS
jgi:hypothetical protein